MENKQKLTFAQDTFNAMCFYAKHGFLGKANILAREYMALCQEMGI